MKCMRQHSCFNNQHGHLCPAWPHITNIQQPSFGHVMLYLLRRPAMLQYQKAGRSLVRSRTLNGVFPSKYYKLQQAMVTHLLQVCFLRSARSRQYLPTTPQAMPCILRASNTRPPQWCCIHPQTQGCRHTKATMCAPPPTNSK